jgi:hypothetical protein
MSRLAPLLLLVVAACVPGRRATLRPGSDMALPRSPGVTVAKKGGQTCGSGSVGGVGVIVGDAVTCSPLSPDSTRRPTAKPPGMP